MAIMDASSVPDAAVKAGAAAAAVAAPDADDQVFIVSDRTVIITCRMTTLRLVSVRRRNADSVAARLKSPSSTKRLPRKLHWSKMKVEVARCDRYVRSTKHV